MGESIHGKQRVAGRDLQGQRRLLLGGDIDQQLTAGGWWNVGFHTGLWDSSIGGEHVVVLGPDLRRGELAVIRERHAGSEPGADGEHRKLDEPVTDWGRQYLRAVLPREDRRSSGVQ